MKNKAVKCLEDKLIYEKSLRIILRRAFPQLIQKVILVNIVKGMIIFFFMKHPFPTHINIGRNSKYEIDMDCLILIFNTAD